MNILQGQLRNQIDKYCDLSELKGICFDLDIDFDNLPGETKKDKIQSLIVYLDNRSRLAYLVAHLQNLRPDVNWRELNTESVQDIPCPYLGLFAFQENDALNFFGRETYVEKLVQAASTQNFVAVVGSSGSGKSSVVMAGLIPKLRRQGNWIVIILRPGNRPFYNLATELVKLDQTLTSRTIRLDETRHQANALSRTKSPLPLTDIFEDLWREQTEDSHFLLIVDQFEELYTLCPDLDFRRRFLDSLLAVTETPFVTLLLTLRADFLGQALGYRPLADALQGHDIKLGPMTVNELRQAITLPAQYANVCFEPGLEERILGELRDEPGNLPLLQFALTQLWGQQERRQLTHAAYEEIGRVEGALAHYADQVYAGLDEIKQMQTHRLLIQLVKPGEGTEDTRRLVLHSELKESDWQLARQLANERLVVTGQDSDGRETVEVVHEALIRRWGQLRQWIEADRAFRTWQERLRYSLHQWEFGNLDEEALLHGAPLIEAENWLVQKGLDLLDTEKQYIQVSLQYKQKQERSQGRRTLILVVSLVIITLLSLFTFFINDARQESELAEQETNALRLALASQNQLDTNHELALLLAVEAAYEVRSLAADRNPPLDINRTLRQALLHRGQSLALLTAHTEPINQIALSPEGNYFLTASDKDIYIWNATNYALVNHIFISQGIHYAAWSPDEYYIAIATMRENAQIWETTGNAPTFSLNIGSMVNYLAWSKDGGRLATAGQNKELTIWHINKHNAVPAFSLEHPASVQFAEWNKEGNQIITISGHQVHLWSIDTNIGSQILVFQNDGRIVETALWNQDETLILTVDNKVKGNAKENNVYVWDVQTGEKIKTLVHSTEIHEALWSKNGNYILTAGDDGLIRLWDVEREDVKINFVGHNESVNDISWSNDEQQILSASHDDTIIIWNAKTGEQVARLTGHRGWAIQAIWNQNETRIISISDDTTIRIWNPFQGTESATLTGHTESIGYVEWSHDGTRIVTASEDKTARIWDATTGEMLFLLYPHEGPVNQAVWSPDDKYIITVSNEGLIRFWNTQNGRLLRVINGHEIFVNQAMWYDDGNGLAVVTASEDRTTKLWSLLPPDQVILKHTFVAQGAINRAVWNHAGTKLATVAFYMEGTPIQIWDVSTGRELLSMVGHIANVGYIDWNRDDTEVVTASDDNTAIIWDAITGAQLFVLDDHTGSVNQATWQPSGSLIVTASDDGRAIIWDSTNGNPIYVLEGHGNKVNQANWDPKGDYIVTASDDKTARIWDVQNGTQVAVLEGHSGFVNQAVWDPGGKRIATASTDNTVRIYYVLLDDLLQIACQKVVRNMSSSEWRLFMGDKPYRETCPGKLIPNNAP